MLRHLTCCDTLCRMLLSFDSEIHHLTCCDMMCRKLFVLGKGI